MQIAGVDVDKQPPRRSVHGDWTNCSTDRWRRAAKIVVDWCINQLIGMFRLEFFKTSLTLSFTQIIGFFKLASLRPRSLSKNK